MGLDVSKVSPEVGNRCPGKGTERSSGTCGGNAFKIGVGRKEEGHKKESGSASFEGECVLICRRAFNEYQDRRGDVLQLRS